MTTQQLKLAAADEEDLKIISAHLQDAVLLVGDIRFDPVRHTATFLLNRFDWQHAMDGKRRKKQDYRRCQAALLFDRVHNMQSRKIRRDAPMAVLELLSLSFTATDAPSGHVDLLFAGGGTLRLDVECIEARLSDLDGEWTTPHMPRHDDEAGGHEQAPDQ